MSFRSHFGSMYGISTSFACTVFATKTHRLQSYSRHRASRETMALHLLPRPDASACPHTWYTKVTRISSDLLQARELVGQESYYLRLVHLPVIFMENFHGHPAAESNVDQHGLCHLQDWQCTSLAWKDPKVARLRHELRLERVGGWKC